MLEPRLDVLAEAQLRLWPELGATPAGFVLYGGTAIALRLGHRPSIDFDFFSFDPFDPRAQLDDVPYLRSGATILQMAPNTLSCRVDRGGPVQVSFFGGLSIGQVAPPEMVSGPRIAVAALIDLGGLKVSVVTQRAEAKDYFDIHAMLQAGLSLSEMLGAASAIYGEAFAPLVSLKALAYHEEPALADLPESLRRDLIAAVKSVEISRLPAFHPIRARRERG